MNIVPSWHGPQPRASGRRTGSLWQERTRWLRDDPYPEGSKKNRRKNYFTVLCNFFHSGQWTGMARLWEKGWPASKVKSHIKHLEDMLCKLSNYLITSAFTQSLIPGVKWAPSHRALHLTHIKIRDSVINHTLLSSGCLLLIYQERFLILQHWKCHPLHPNSYHPGLLPAECDLTCCDWSSQPEREPGGLLDSSHPLVSSRQWLTVRGTQRSLGHTMAPFTVTWHQSPALDTAPWTCLPRFNSPLTSDTFAGPVWLPEWAHNLIAQT